MQGRAGLPVHDDIIDKILCYSSTFGTLKSTILSCKSFHRVFARRPNSIIRDVAYNFAGPALPQLMRLVRYEGLDEPRPRDPDSIPKETEDISPITCYEVDRIIEHVQTARKLEDVFSLRHKDRASKTSKLTPLESWRFCRAIYRLMMYSAVFPGNRFTDHYLEQDTEEEDEDHGDAHVLGEKPAWKKFLAEFDTAALYQIHSAGMFLLELESWTSSFICYTPLLGNIDRETVLSAGPSRILKAYESRDLSVLDYFFNLTRDGDDEILEAFLSDPLSKIWDERKVEAPDSDLHWRSIVSEVMGEHDTCTQCHEPDGLNLWGETNYHYLDGISMFSFGYGLLASDNTSSRPYTQLLKGKLKYNRPVTDYLESQLLGVRSVDHEYNSRLLTEMFDLKTPNFTNWDRSDWLCEICLVEFISAHLHIWLLDQKRKAGETIPEDCQYGYNCQKQIRDLEHARKLNHLCDPD